MHRRDFLKTLAVTSAATTASAVFPQIVRAETLGLNGGVAPSNRLTFGLIGSGGQGRYVMSGTLANKRAQVVAVCDVDSERTPKARADVERSYASETENGTYHGCAEYHDYRELLARSDIDAVIIATPDHWHALIAVAAARASKHIYCEKPAASSIPEGRAMVDAITRAGVICQIGSQQRSSGEFQRVVGLVRTGVLGKITRVEIGLPADTQARSPIPPPPQPDPIPSNLDYDFWLGPAEALPYFRERCHFHWRWNFAFAGGQVSDWIGHHYDIGALAIGVANSMPVAIKNAKATFINNSSIYNTADEYSFESHYANGAVLHVGSNYRDGVRIEGTEGWVYATRGLIEHSSEILRLHQLPANATGLNRGPRNHMDNFIDCALTGAEARCPIQDAHCVAAAAHLANAAFRSGKQNINFDPLTEQITGASEAAVFLRRTYRGPYVL